MVQHPTGGSTALVYSDGCEYISKANKKGDKECEKVDADEKARVER